MHLKSGEKTLANSNLRKFFLLDSRTSQLLIETFVYLAWARFLLLFPFKRVAPSLGTHMEETTNIPIKINRKILIHIHDAIQIMSKHTWWDSKCLVRAIAGMKMLERRGIESTLYLGIAKDNSGKTIAHAWLRSGSYFVTGAEEMERFIEVARFAKKFSNHQ